MEAASGTLVAGQAANEEQVAELCRDADGVLNARAPITKRAIDAMQRCRIIVRYGIGVDTIDVPAATARGIMVANVPDYCLDEVSDHALALLLMLSRQMIPSIALARDDTWPVSKMPPGLPPARADLRPSRLRADRFAAGRESFRAGNARDRARSVPERRKGSRDGRGTRFLRRASGARGFYFAARAAHRRNAAPLRHGGLRENEEDRVDPQHRARRPDRRSGAAPGARCWADCGRRAGCIWNRRRK